MFMRTLLTLSALLLLGQTPAPARSLDDKRISITVPAAPWTLTLPGEHLKLEKQMFKPGADGKPDGRYGYVLLRDGKNGLSISMYIEPAVKCKSSKECRDLVWKAGNPGWENPQNVVLSEIGDVSFFEFFVPSSEGVPVRQHHMYAQFVVDGFWVDLHISKPLYQPHEHKLFEEVVKSVKFEPKKEDVVRAQDSPEEAARRAAESWILLWDAGKYDESYELLDQDTRAAVSKRQWFMLWSGVRKPLGAVKSRKLNRAEYIKSLPGAPDREGAVIAYESSFENKKGVLETFGMMRQKDGTWRVGHYLTNVD
jgi:hypothetical protein